ncbi:DNA damage-inducible transcript 3 protein [Hypanus sabinus]|uniref:DNA damage-inducible transcript 3 protein n=1 Tax=Hypanus sabinus TaxID=79690 RepID=UPI0028C3BE1B|nr:DNA damage-inducible transcript 3 protein [Hypanus sabinus]XP_059812251.1 DNA damage-inducible transcript 3 protein [Hypanus sabinus]
MQTNNMTQDTGDPLLTTVMEVPPSPPALLWGLDLESWLEDIESVLVPSPILEDSKCRSELPLLLDLDSVLSPTGEEPGDSDRGPGEAQAQLELPVFQRLEKGDNMGEVVERGEPSPEMPDPLPPSPQTHTVQEGPAGRRGLKRRRVRDEGTVQLLEKLAQENQRLRARVEELAVQVQQTRELLIQRVVGGR